MTTGPTSKELAFLETSTISGHIDADGQKINPDSVLGKALQCTRDRLVAFLSEIDKSNPYAGKITKNVLDNEAGEVPMTQALVYLVDDEPANSRALKRTLGERFSNVKTFNDGEYALDAISQEGKLVEVPHLVISDTNMPRMSGTELAKALQDIDPGIRPRFIGLSGIFTEDNLRTYSELGHPVFEKPYNRSNVLAVALQELRRHPGFRPESK